MWNSHRHRGSRRISACAALLVTLAAPAALRAQEPPSVVIIFDGSGSMAGNIEGVRGSKVVLAREAVRQALTKVGPQTRVGLVSFGHRRGDCGDVELLRPLEPLDVQRIGDSLEKMNPRGRGPLTTALLEAAKPLAAYRAAELQEMQRNFYGFDPSYHVARYHFVSRSPHSWTPRHLARHRDLDWKIPAA